MSNYHSLSDVSGLNFEHLKRLTHIGIRNAEHLAAIVETDGGCWRLSGQLGIDPDRLNNLCLPFTEAPDSGLFEQTRLHIPMGLVPNSEPIGTTNWIDWERWPQGVAYPESGHVIDAATMNGVYNQSDRGTCVSFAFTTSLQTLYPKDGYPEFSKQFHYFQCREKVKHSGPGTYGDIGHQVLAEYGCPPEELMPYNLSNDPADEGQYPPSKDIIDAALEYRTAPGFMIDNREHIVEVVKAMISGKFTSLARAMPIGVTIFNSSFSNRYTWETGEVSMPLTGEKPAGHHAFTVVGFRDNPDLPGGGELWVLNSWGERFASKCELGAGICRIPYAYIAAHCCWGSVLLRSGEVLDGYHHSSVSTADTNVDRLQRVALSEEVNIHIGDQLDNGAPVFWESNSLDNKNRLIVGSTGSGKSHLAQHLISEQIKQDPHTCNIIIDVHGHQRDYARMGKHLVDAGYSKDIARVDVGRVGLPMQFLKHDGNTPLDIFLSNRVSDVRCGNNSIGNVQAQTLYNLCLHGSIDNWSNTDLYSALDRLADTNLAAQLKPFQLLLRSDGVDVELLLDHRLVVFDLSAFRSDSRVMYVVLLGALLFEYQQQRSKSLQATRKSIHFVVDEGAVLTAAKPVLSRLLQEGRKFEFSSTFITQLDTDVPDYIEKNCATRIYMNGAAQQSKWCKGLELPVKRGEALCFMGNGRYLVSVPDFDGSIPLNQELQITQITPSSHALSAVLGLLGVAQVGRGKSDKIPVTSVEYVHPVLFPDHIRPLLEQAGQTIEHISTEWYSVWSFEAQQGIRFIFDPLLKIPLAALNPVSFYGGWQQLCANIDGLLALLDGSAGKERITQLSQAGLVFRDKKGKILIHHEIQRPPLIKLPRTGFANPESWGVAAIAYDNTDQLASIYEVWCSLWGRTLPHQYSSLSLPVLRVVGNNGSVCYPAWQKPMGHSFRRLLSNPISGW